MYGNYYLIWRSRLLYVWYRKAAKVWNRCMIFFNRSEIRMRLGIIAAVAPANLQIDVIIQYPIQCARDTLIVYWDETLIPN